MRLRVVLAVPLLVALAACGGPAPPPPNGWTTLPNGLQVAIHPIDGAKDLVVLTAFGIGSDQDPVGKSGLAHLAEHLYVTAAAGDTPSRTVDEWQTRYLSRCSAQTETQATSHEVVVPPARLPAEIADAAARMSDLRVEESDLDRERPRVLEQIAEAESRVLEPNILAIRLAQRRASPGGRAPGHQGSRDDVAKITLEELRDRLRRFYRPANARLVLVGAVDAKAAMAEIVKRFGGLAPGEPAPATVPGEPPQTGTIEVDAGAPRRDGEEPGTWVCVGYPMDGLSDTERGALRLLQSHSHGAARVSALPNPCGDSVVLRVVEQLAPAETLSRIDDYVKEFAGTLPEPGEIKSQRKSVSDLDELKTFSDLPDMSSSPELGKMFARWKSPEGLAALIVCRALTLESERRFADAFEHLTHDDVAAFAAKRLAPQMRVVVIVHGFAPKEEPVSAALPTAQLPAEVRIRLFWDEANQKVTRKLGGAEYADDAALEKAVKAARDPWIASGRADSAVTIDADVRVPWKDVMDVVNLLKRCGIEKVEFAMGAPPKLPTK